MTERTYTWKENFVVLRDDDKSDTFCGEHANIIRHELVKLRLDDHASRVCYLNGFIVPHVPGIRVDIKKV